MLHLPTTVQTMFWLAVAAAVASDADSASAGPASVSRIAWKVTNSSFDSVACVI